ncbi:MAG: ATP synthase F1 subunit epsilon [Bacteroidota bacterium]
MYLEIITPDIKLFEGDVSLVQLPGIDGSFELLNNHAPLVSALTKGKIKLVNAEKNTVYIDIKGGVIEVNNNKIIVLAE